MTGPLLAVGLVNLGIHGWSVGAAQSVLQDYEIRRFALNSETSELLRDWALRLRSVFDVTTVESRCETINVLLEAGTARAYLTTHDRLRPHLHFASDDDDVVPRVKAVTAGGLALFIVESDGRRLGICARKDCGTAFVDTSRNGKRSYCSARCGNYEAVQRHRRTERAIV